MDQKLLNAVYNGDLKTIEQILRSGEMMSLKNEDRAELPRMIASTGNWQMLALLASRSHAIAWEPDDAGRDVLHYAARSGSAETVAYAVETLGMNPLRGDRDGTTALDLAQESAAGKWLEEYL